MFFSPVPLLFVSPSSVSSRHQTFNQLISINQNIHQSNRKIPSSLNIVSTDHASEVFHLIDTDNSGVICSNELTEVLERLDILASTEEVGALAKYLDVNNDGDICEDDFLTWYKEAASTVAAETTAIRQALLGRRTVNDFDKTPVPDKILMDAIEAAIAAPNHKLTEPWRFITLGKKSIGKIAKLNAKAIAKKDPEKAKKKQKRWESIPGWCVVTCQKSDDPIQEEEDFAAVSCAIQNFSLSMWADGVGVKWTSGPVTRTKEFAEICDIDTDKEKFVGCLWYGFASGGLGSLPLSPKRKKSAKSVLTTLS